MKRNIPWRKRWFSYLNPIHLETLTSDFGGEVSIYVNKGRLQLTSEDAIYSYDDLYDNFGEAFNRTDFAKIEGDNVLMLGLGLASIPFILEKILKKEFYYTAIELDSAVIQLASKYSLPDITSSVQIIQEDAMEYIHYCMDEFDMIFIDVFIDKEIPENAKQKEFLETIKTLLKPEGALFYNWLYLTPEEIQQADHYFTEIFLLFFPNAFKIIVAGNAIFLNNKEFLKK